MNIEELVWSDKAVDDFVNQNFHRNINLAELEIGFDKYWGTVEFIWDDTVFHPTKAALDSLTNIIGFSPKYLPKDKNKASAMWKIGIEGKNETQVTLTSEKFLLFGDKLDVNLFLEKILEVDDTMRVIDAQITPNGVVLSMISTGTTSTDKSGEVLSIPGLKMTLGAKAYVEPFVFLGESDGRLADAGKYSLIEKKQKKKSNEPEENTIQECITVSNIIQHEFNSLKTEVFDLNSLPPVLRDTRASAKHTANILESVVSLDKKPTADVIRYISAIGIEEKDEKYFKLAGDLCRIYHAARCKECGHVL